MPRPYRQVGNDISYHVIARCNNESFLFTSAIDFNLYLECLKETLSAYPFELNNYTLMHNHVHLILTTKSPHGIDKIIHHCHSTFSKRYNKIHKRRGHFWRDRYKSLVISDDSYGIACMRYINRNPVRARIVENPGQWPWSGYHFYALGKENKLITEFPSYLALGSNQKARRSIYNDIVLVETDREKDEKKLFSGKIRPASRRFTHLWKQVVQPMVDQKVPGTFWSYPETDTTPNLASKNNKSDETSLKF
jgi:putative transposase